MLIDQDPVRDDELSGLFDHLRQYSTLIVAVSGGADSTALLHLLARWSLSVSAAVPKTLYPALVVATVDHGLRPESATEALAVTPPATELGLPHHVLLWEHTREKPTSAVQVAARTARYGLLETLARDHPKPAVVTAHHQDDQAETLLMRLARGSGLDGLAGIRRSRPAHGFQLVAREHPLLGVPKARLVATLRAAGLTWCEDPSNANRAFERARWRDAERQLADLGLTAQTVARSARRLERARQALEAVTDAAWDRIGHTHDGAFATLSASAFDGEPEEIRLRLILKALTAFGGQDQAPSLAQAENLVAALASHPFNGQTLAGCRIERDVAEIRVYREPGRQGLPVSEIAPGQSFVWDNRFRVELHFGARQGECTSQPASVRALGADGLALVRLQGDDFRLPARIAWTLPSLWVGPNLAAVPQLGHQSAGFTAQFWWERTLPMPPRQTP